MGYSNATLKTIPDTVLCCSMPRYKFQLCPMQWCDSLHYTYRIKLKLLSTKIDTSHVVIPNRVQDSNLVGLGSRGESTGTSGAGKDGDSNLHGRGSEKKFGSCIAREKKWRRTNLRVASTSKGVCLRRIRKETKVELGRSRSSEPSSIFMS